MLKHHHLTLGWKTTKHFKAQGEAPRLKLRREKKDITEAEKV